MPETIKLATRIQNKYKTLNEWNSIAAGTFTPLKGEVCYAADNNILYQKIGDGITDFVELPWLETMAPQADNNENDENSLSYIKNRIAFEGMIDLPEEEQVIAQGGAELRFGADTTNIESALGITPEQLGVPAHLTDIEAIYHGKDVTYKGSIVDLFSNDTDDMSIVYGHKDSYLEFFKKDVSIQTGTTMNDNTVTCLMWGNPIMANLTLQMMGLTMEPFSIESNADLDYCYIFIVNSVDGVDYCHSQSMTDANKYTELWDSENFKIQIKQLKTNGVHPIEEKYLSNVHLDQNEMDSTKISYIHNRYGNVAVVNSTKYFGFFDYRTDITLKKNYPTNYTVITEWPDEDMPIENPFLITQYKIDLRGSGGELDLVPLFDKEFICPVYYFSNENNITLQAIGNPALLSENHRLLNFDMTDDLAFSDLEDNGIPFLFFVDWNAELPFLNMTVLTNSILDEMIASGQTEGLYLSSMTAIQKVYQTNLIPKYMLPNEVFASLWNFDTKINSITGPGAYEASGVNSLAIGEGVRANSNNQIAQGRYNVADGLNQYAHIIGNGESESQRSNAHTVDWDGNAWFAGDITIGNDKKSVIALNIAETDEGKFLVVKDGVISLINIPNIAEEVL